MSQSTLHIGRKEGKPMFGYNYALFKRRESLQNVEKLIPVHCDRGNADTIPPACPKKIDLKTLL